MFCVWKFIIENSWNFWIACLFIPIKSAQHEFHVCKQTHLDTKIKSVSACTVLHYITGCSVILTGLIDCWITLTS